MQSSQFNFFLLGVVDPHIYATWVSRKISLFREEEVIPGWSALAGWQTYGRRAQEQNILFTSFVEKLKNYSRQKSNTPDYDWKFSQQEIAEIYNLSSASRFRKSVTTRSKSWNVAELQGLHALILRDVQQELNKEFAEFKDPKNFQASASHEKVHIIGPALLRAVQELKVDPREFLILDYGCGPFQVGKYLLDAGYSVDGYDPAANMISLAFDTYGSSVVGRLFSRPDQVADESYEVCFMAFVHQTAPTRAKMAELVRGALRKVTSGGYMILIGAHPEFLGNAFSASQHASPSSVEDGTVYRGTIYDDTGASYPLAGDHYFSLQTIHSVVSEVGLREVLFRGIEDVGSASRPAGKGTPYFVLTALKP